MINPKVFQLADLVYFEPKDAFEDLYRDMSENIKNPNMTIISLHWKGKILAILGVVKQRRGCGELWLMPSTHVDSVKFEFFKIVKWLIYDVVFNELGYHRLEIAIKEGWEKGYRWARKLGFSISHVCDAYDPYMQTHVIFKKGGEVMAVGAIVAAVGTGLNFMGQMEAAEKEEEAARFNAENSRQQLMNYLDVMTLTRNSLLERWNSSKHNR